MRRRNKRYTKVEETFLLEIYQAGKSWKDIEITFEERFGSGRPLDGLRSKVYDMLRSNPGPKRPGHRPNEPDSSAQEPDIPVSRASAVGQNELQPAAVNNDPVISDAAPNAGSNATAVPNPLYAWRLTNLSTSHQQIQNYPRIVDLDSPTVFSTLNTQIPNWAFTMNHKIVMVGPGRFKFVPYQLICDMGLSWDVLDACEEWSGSWQPYL